MMNKGPVISFHPMVPGEMFHWERGMIEEGLVQALKTARGVILPQTVCRELYALCRHLCPNVFPNYDLRFQWEGKSGDAMLFWLYGIPHPRTSIFPSVEALIGDHPAVGYRAQLPAYPFVLKGAQGGEGTRTWLIGTDRDFRSALRILERDQWKGIAGGVVQEYVPDINGVLRVVVIGSSLRSYWKRSASGFLHSVARGGEIDHRSDPHLQAAGRRAVRALCRRTGINLAGFDLVFPGGSPDPVFLEINYTFGRTGLGGSDVFYRLLRREVIQWLDTF